MRERRKTRREQGQDGHTKGFEQSCSPWLQAPAGGLLFFALVSLGLKDGSIVHAFAREPTTVRPSGHSAAEPPGCVHSAWQLGSGASGLEVPLQPRGASGFLSTPHVHSLAPVDTVALVDARVGWASWSKSQSPANAGHDLGLDVVELGYMPFETSGEALQASTGRCDLEATSKYV